MPFWDDDTEEEFMSFRDLTTFDGQDGDDEQIHDRELECLSDHEVVAAAMASQGTSGHEAEHPGPERPPTGTSGWKTEQDGPERPAETQKR